MRKKEKRRAGDREVHYTYLIRDNLNNLVYYGVHSTDYDPSDIEQYYGSSKRLTHAISIFGIENFSKEVRRTFKSRVLADAWEYKVLRRMKVRSNKSFYNSAEGGEGYVTTGYVTVRSIFDGKTFRVPVDDPYIGVLYEYTAKGRPCKQEVKDFLSDLYTGTRQGSDNPVHKIKDKVAWRKKVSAGNTGKKLPEAQIDKLKEPSSWGHLRNYKNSTEVNERMHFLRSINNNKFFSIFAYKGELYLHREGLPVDIKNKNLVTLKECHPLVNTLVAGGVEYPDIKTAAEGVGCKRNTVVNRINNDIMEDYYYFTREDILNRKRESEVYFLKEMRLKYESLLSEQRDYIEPFTTAICDKDVTKIFLEKGNFVEGTVFTRLQRQDKFKNYCYFDVFCPTCDTDKYAVAGASDGHFTITQGSLYSGKTPCRCNPRHRFTKEELEFDVIEVCKVEGLKYLGFTGEFTGKKESKITWECRNGNLHKDTRVGLFLDKGSRCKCCRAYYKDNPPTISIQKKLVSHN